jgi:hypothetical protein
MILASILTFYITGASPISQYQVANVPEKQCQMLARIGRVSGDRPEGKVSVKAVCSK